MQQTRRSKKRDAILSAIRGTKSHPSAEWVYQTLKPQYPDLSLGTVYRNLVFLQEQGAIASIGVVGGQERFDAATAPHTHFVCNSCNTVIDLETIQVDSAMLCEASVQYNLSVTRHELILYGLCPCCQQGAQQKSHEEE